MPSVMATTIDTARVTLPTMKSHSPKPIIAGTRFGTSETRPSLKLRSTRKMTKEIKTSASEVPFSIEGTSRAEIIV